jgi:cyclopropane-fatty-acyl-phospholipid synthase
MSATEASDDPRTEPPRDRPRPGLAARLARTMKAGTLELVMPDGATHRIARTAAPAATIILRQPRALSRQLAGGSLGLAEGYADGLWDSPDILAVMALGAANEGEWERMLRGRPWESGLSRLLNALRPGARGRARRGLVAQYDLDSAFFGAWLDPTMSWSSAYFGGVESSLEVAQLHKIHRLCQLLALRPGMRLLEIGCGWGGFAEVAARDYGVSVVGITRSRSQLDHAQRRIAQAGLSSRVELRLQDYRDTTGSFDRIASVEMFTAVGEEFWPVYFKQLRDLLRRNGVAGLQVTTIAERFFEDQRHGGSFVHRQILPGGLLPTKRRLRHAISRAGMAWGEETWFARDYAETLARWRASFLAAWPRIVAETSMNSRPCDERLRRSWEYYLAYCETAFRVGWADVGQILIAPNK